MARTRTLGELAADVRYRADIEGATARHPDANIYRLINESWQTLREICSDNGHQLYLVNAAGTLTPGYVTGTSFGGLDLPADCVRVFGLDIVAVGGERLALDPIDFSQRNEFLNAYGQRTGVPRFFHIYNVGAETTTTVTAGKVALLPASDGAYAYTIWYLPAWVDRTNTAHVFNGVAGWEEFVVWDCVLKIAARDNDMAGTAGVATQERGAALERIIKAANTVQRVGPATKVDDASRCRGRQKFTRDRFWR